MSARFHLAIEVGDLDTAVAWYRDVIGCKLGDYEKGLWQDINFWDNELTLHSSDPAQDNMPALHDTDMKDVAVPHFGVHMPWAEFHELLKRAKEDIIEGPYHRFEGKPREQKTVFIKDPHCNILEMKTMLDPETLWKAD